MQKCCHYYISFLLADPWSRLQFRHSWLYNFTSFTKSSISASPLSSSLYNPSTYSAHLSITSSFSNKPFPCLLLIVCSILFSFGRSSLISDTVIGCVLYPVFQFRYTYCHNIFIFGFTIFVSLALTSYKFLPLSCFLHFLLSSILRNNSEFIQFCFFGRSSFPRKSPIQLITVSENWSAKAERKQNVHCYKPLRANRGRAFRKRWSNGKMGWVCGWIVSELYVDELYQKRS